MSTDPKQDEDGLDLDALVKLAHETLDRATPHEAGEIALSLFPVRPGEDAQQTHESNLARGAALAGIMKRDEQLDVRALADGVIALAAEVKDLQRLLARQAEPTFDAMHIDRSDGSVVVPVADSRVTHAIIDHLARMLTGAPNYVAIRGYHHEAGPIECIVQRVSKLTPHTAREQAEHHLARAVALLHEHRIPWDGPTTFLPDAPPDRVAQADDARPRPWLRILIDEHPNVLSCERCGARQAMPEQGTAAVLAAMIAAFGTAHNDCQEGDATKLACAEDDG